MVEEAPVAAPAKVVKKAASKTKKTGPSLGDLFVKVFTENPSRAGLSLAALKKGLRALGYDTDKNKARIRITVRRLVIQGTLVQVKGIGASGSFKLNRKVDTKSKKAVAKKAAPKAKKATAKKSPAAKKPVTPAKKPAAAKKSGKKAKKTVAKSPKKKPAKSPKKAPVKKAPVKKAPAKKAPAKKPAAKKVAKPKPAKKTASKKK